MGCSHTGAGTEGVKIIRTGNRRGAAAPEIVASRRDLLPWGGHGDTQTAVYGWPATAETRDGVDITVTIIDAAGNDDQVLALFWRG